MMKNLDIEYIINMHNITSLSLFCKSQVQRLIGLSDHRPRPAQRAFAKTHPLTVSSNICLERRKRALFSV